MRRAAKTRVPTAAAATQPAPSDGSAEELARFEEFKLQRREKQAALGDRLVERENKRVEIANVHSLWFSIFGALYLRCETAYERKLELQAYLEEHERNPTWTRADLDRAMLEQRTASARKVTALRRNVLLAGERKLLPYGLKRMCGDEELALMHHEMARALRQIWRRIHPDALKQDPAYAQLTEKERQYFKDLLGRLVPPRAAELGFDPIQVGFEHRSPAELHRIQQEIEAILHNPGADTDLDELIVGDSLAERTAWLQADIALLEQGIDEVEAELCALRDDPEYAERRFQLAVPEQHEDIKARLLDQAKVYEQEVARLERELTRVLGEEASPG